jgi:predicted nucleotidyltransferase
MSEKTILKTIKSMILAMLPGAKILLFGSRARGDYNKDSDFDILIITPKSLPLKEKRNWINEIGAKLVDALEVPIDVLLNSEEEVAIKRELPGHTINWAMKEGIVL